MPKLSIGLVVGKLMVAWDQFLAFIYYTEMGVGGLQQREGKTGGAGVHCKSLAET